MHNISILWEQTIFIFFQLSSRDLLKKRDWKWVIPWNFSNLFIISNEYHFIYLSSFNTSIKSSQQFEKKTPKHIPSIHVPSFKRERFWGVNSITDFDAIEKETNPNKQHNKIEVFIWLLYFKNNKGQISLNKNMIKSLGLILCLMTICTLADPGDILYSRCQAVTIAGQTLQNVCIVLRQGQQCSVVGFYWSFWSFFCLCL